MNYIILLIFSSLISFPLYSQYNQADIWYFRNGNGIDFNATPPKPLNNHVFWSPRVSTICDKQGKLLFYTDGMTVVNKNHKIMKNRSNLLGGADIMIVPHPNNKNLYYLFSVSVYDKMKTDFWTKNVFADEDTTKWRSFTTEDSEKEQKIIVTNNQKTARLYYHIIDISKNNGLGEVIEKNKLMYQKIKADLVVARHINDKDYWLITHEFMTNKFKVFLINEKGLQEKPIETEIGMKLYDENNLHFGFIENKGKRHDIVISPDFKKISIYDGLHKKVQIFDFDNLTGKITDHFSINLKLPYFVMSSCFSPNSTKFYITHRNEGGDVKKPFTYFIQYNLGIKNEEQILKQKKQQEYYYNNIDRSKNDKMPDGDLQVAPDGKIYFTKCTGGIGVIENPNNDLDSIEFNYEALRYEVHPAFTLPKVAHLLPPFYLPIKLGNIFQREILFETGKYDLKEYHYPILGDIVQFLKENPKTNITISGHTDNEGNPQANKTLSENRAKSVKNYLISQQINPNRITSQGFGDTKPLLENNTPENKRKNRRIEFLVE